MVRAMPIGLILTPGVGESALLVLLALTKHSLFGAERLSEEVMRDTALGQATYPESPNEALQRHLNADRNHGCASRTRDRLSVGREAGFFQHCALHHRRSL